MSVWLNTLLADLKLPDRFGGPQLKLARASRHLRALDRLVAHYESLSPYVMEYRLNTDRSVYEGRMIEQVKPLPDFGIVIGEIVYQLRSALDHVIYEFSVPNFPETVPELRKAERVPQFPLFLDDPTDGGKKPFDDRHLRFVAPPVLQLVGSYQPYLRWPGEQVHPLAVLEALNIRDKHRLIVPAATDIALATEPYRPEGSTWTTRTQGDNREVYVEIPVESYPEQDFDPIVSYHLVIRVQVSNDFREGLSSVNIGYLRRIYNFVVDTVIPSFADLVAHSATRRY